MHQYYDYCDTYDSYDSGLALDGKNSVKTFSCEVCKQSKFILKKSVNDPIFKCEECIQKKESVSDPNNVALNMPATTTTTPTTTTPTTTTPTTTTPTPSFQASPAMLTMDGMYQQQQPYQQQQQQQQPMLETTPQFSWRWFNFFV
jgi:hypothetical protein